MDEYRGSLYVFVDRLDEPASARPTPESGDVFELRQRGEMLWFLNGWAVGGSARSQYCARTSISKLRCFATFSEAKDFVRRMSKGRPAESFHLVYEVDGRKSIVTGLEQIQLMDRRFTRNENRTLFDGEECPELDMLTEKVGKIVAMHALVLLRTLSQEGEAAARARFSAATYGRLWQVLQDAALVDGFSPSALLNRLDTRQTQLVSQPG